MVKRVVLVRRRVGMEHQEFVRHWRTTHAAIAGRLPGLQRYVINVPIEADGTESWDGVGELWFPDADVMNRAFEAMGAEIGADLALFVAETETYLVAEHEVALPGT